MRIGITDFSSYKAVVIARYLKENYPEVQIVSIDTRPFTKFLRSRYSDHHLVVSNGSIDGYIHAVAKIVEQYNVDVLLPVNSQELGPFLRARTKFGRALEYWGSYKDYCTLHDKAKFQALVEGANLPIPRYYAKLSDCMVPAVLKPVGKSSSKGVRYFLSEMELDEFKREFVDDKSDYIIQEYKDGYGAGFSGFFRDGMIVTGYAHTRLAEYPVSGGSSVYRKGADPDKAVILEGLVRRLLGHVKWSGFGMFEFKVTNSGEVVFIECNPRIWGSIGQGLANRVNFFEHLLGQGGDSSSRSPSTENQRLTYLSPLIWLSFAGYVRRFKFLPIFEFVRHWRRNKADINLVDDPLGWLALVLRGG